jgi:hypothetical protein
MIITTGNIFDSCVVKTYFGRSLTPNYLIIFYTKLSILIMTPSKDLAFSCEKTRKHWSTHHFYNRYVEFNQIWQTRYLINFICIFLKNFISFYFLETFSSNKCQTTWNNKRSLFFINTEKTRINISTSCLNTHFIEVCVFYMFIKKTFFLSVWCFILQNKLVCKTDFRWCIFAPNIYFTQICVFHRHKNMRLLMFVSIP